MASLLLLTNDLLPSSEVLPALGLLSHQIRVMPAEATALLDAPACDAILVDGRQMVTLENGRVRARDKQGGASSMMVDGCCAELADTVAADFFVRASSLLSQLKPRTASKISAAAASS